MYVFLLLSSMFKCILVNLYPMGSGVADHSCLGETRAYACEVNGPTLVWQYSSVVVGFNRLFNTSRPLGQFIDVELESISNDVILSIATVKVNRDINGTTLYCRNSLALARSVGQNITFNVQGNCQHEDA